MSSADEVSAVRILARGGGRNRRLEEGSDGRRVGRRGEVP